ncbi:MAG TPA: RsbRD N-terminal domain-containing protein [Pyrinomonadaceae bacterium]|nr:RsbRD N-terminal domain-containing protein [Pyrinomonadaceae bacterium]
MAEEISRLLQNGRETIVRAWTEKVTSDRRVRSDEQLTYLQLVDHIPQIVEELQQALATERADGARMLEQGREHGRQRWRQGYELKEVVRELTLLRATLLEFLDAYRGAIPAHSSEKFLQSYRKITGFMDEELYKTVEAYLEAPREQAQGNGVNSTSN